MENYIIRIYRRDSRNPRKIMGVVESVEKDVKKTFTDFNQLREIIAVGSTANSGVLRPRKIKANEEVDYEQRHE